MHLDGEGAGPFPEARRAVERADGKLGGWLIESVFAIRQAFPRVHIDVGLGPHVNIKVGFFRHQCGQVHPEHVEETDEVVLGGFTAHSTRYWYSTHDARCIIAYPSPARNPTVQVVDNVETRSPSYVAAIVLR